MPIAYWQDTYYTGNSQIDQQHQQLFTIVNSLHDAIVVGADAEILRDILEKLASNTINHFQLEDELMIAANYPGYDRHKQIHNNLTTKVTSLIDNLHNHDYEITPDITQFLTEWITHHIKGEDRNLMQFLQSRNQNPALNMSSV